MAFLGGDAATVDPRAKVLQDSDFRPAPNEAERGWLGTLYQHVVESMPAALVVIDQDGLMVLVNSETERLFGYDRKELLGRKTAVLLPGSLTSREPQPTAGGRDLLGLRKDGSEFPLEIVWKPLEKEAATFVVVTITDITDRRRAEAVLRESEERLRLMVIAVKGYAIFMLDTDGRVATWNAGAELMKGYRAEEIVGRHFSCFYSPEDVADGKPDRQLREAVAHDRFEDEGWRVRKDGSRFWANVTISVILDEAGLRRGFSKVTRDDTEGKRKIEELQRAHDSLEKSNLELQRFAYIASHDLQTPLRSISGFLQMLQSEYAGKLDAQADDWILRTIQATQVLQESIEDLLSYSRLDSDVHVFKIVPCRSVFDAAVLLLDAPIKETAARITCDDLPIVMGDHSQLIQLMQNLIGNALKYRGDKAPEVHVSAERKGNDWVFSVRDNGIGILPKYRERIFEVFQRLHSQRKYPGTGIGLAICRRVVNLHGGTIWVESEPGRGSIFYFTIPEKEADA
jgi:PAS domain S-box-containing protein